MNRQANPPDSSMVVLSAAEISLETKDRTQVNEQEEGRKGSAVGDVPCLMPIVARKDAVSYGQERTGERSPAIALVLQR